MSADTAPRRVRKFFDKGAFDELREATGKLDFTPDFNPAIEAIIDMAEVALPERLIALIKLQAWGNQKLFAVRDESRNVAFLESDCARRLQVSRQIVNRHTRRLIERCQLRIEEGKLYPVPDPEAERRGRESEVVNHGVDTDSPNVRLLEERWLEQHPAFREELQKANEQVAEGFRRIAEVKRRMQADLRAASASTPVLTDTTESSEQRGGHEGDNGADTAPAPLRTTEPPILIEKKRRIEEGEDPPPTPSREAPAAALTPEIVASETELWSGFLFAVQSALMCCTPPQRPAVREEFEKLTHAERIAAIEGIQTRIQIGEYNEPRYIPAALRYLKEQLWTAPLKPPPERKGASREEESAWETFQRMQRRRQADAAGTGN